MAGRFGFASLIPPGLAVESVDDSEGALVVTARSNARTALCPLCGAASVRVQSHYLRQPSDLPCAGRCVRLRLLVRRFRCGVPDCPRQVFAERFGTTVLAERARRTGRLEEIVHHLGLAMARSGRRQDVAAIRAAITEPWSNGQTEGQITKLKLVKRQMYGRAKLDRLEARLIGAV